ncbi:hypothetical protein [Flagellimonas sp.]|uniref:hypothetical protein n=1 Tax=Flagellimonas sp. TaxID=2058762 RepID=UPI003BAA4180
MKNLKFNITHRGRVYHVFIEMGLEHSFKNKSQARKFIEKYKSVINDNIVIMGAINEQVNSLVMLYYPFIPNRIVRDLHIRNVDFNDCYNRIYNPMKVYVQFVQIRACFNFLEQRLDLMKKYAQRSKRPVLLNQLYPWIKTFELIYRSYQRDIEGLTDGVNYRTELKKLPLTKDTENEEPNNSRQFAT